MERGNSFIGFNIISFSSVSSDDVINFSDCTESVIDELVSSTDGMILTVGLAGGGGW